MRIVMILLAALLTGGFSSAALAADKARHVVVIVWDGMRPDFVTQQNTPTLWQLAREGVTFKHHHPVYLSSTEVNGTAISTGAYPAHDGIVGNKEYRPDIDPLTFIHMEGLGPIRKGDELTRGHYVALPTLVEIVRQAGHKTAVAGAKPVALLLDRSDRATDKAGANVFAGQTLPSDLLERMTNRYGAFPNANAAKPTRNDWTTLALLDSLWADGVPDISSFLWMNQPDLAQHETGPGSERSLAAIHNADDNLARVLRMLEAKGVRDTTDIMVVSDHGFSTVLCLVDLVHPLKKIGLNTGSESNHRPPPATSSWSATAVHHCSTSSATTKR